MDKVYNYVLIGVVWIFSLVLSWMTATASTDSRISEAIRNHDESTVIRWVAIEKRLDRIDNKIDALSTQVTEKR